MHNKSTIAMCKSAAHLIASLHADHVVGLLPRESRDAADILEKELVAAGYMDAYAPAGAVVTAKYKVL